MPEWWRSKQQPVRRDDAVDLVQRREADRALRRGGEPGDVAAADVGLVLRRACRRCARRRLRPACVVQSATLGGRLAGLPGAAAASAGPRAPPRRRRGRRAAAARREASVPACVSFMGFDSLPSQLCMNLHMFGEKYFRRRRPARGRPRAARRRACSAMWCITTSQIGGTFGALVDAGPAGHGVVLAPARAACRCAATSGR